MMFAVEKASMKSPLPWRAVEPVRASPSAARFASRVDHLQEAAEVVVDVLRLVGYSRPWCQYTEHQRVLENRQYS